MARDLSRAIAAFALNGNWAAWTDRFSLIFPPRSGYNHGRKLLSASDICEEGEDHGATGVSA